MKEIFIAKHPAQSFLIWGAVTTYISMMVFQLYKPLLPSVITVAGGVLITGIAAILAFQNMNKNEVRKQSREQYQAYCRYVGGMQQRYQCLKNIRHYFEPFMSSQQFIRGAGIPFIPTKFFYDEINFSELTFMGAGLPKEGPLKEGVIDDDYICLNIVAIRQLDTEFKVLKSAIEYRNEVHNKTILPLISSAYMGGGVFNLKVKDFTKTLPFYDFSQFLKQSEDILFIADDLLREFEGVLEKLNEFGHLVLDKGIVEENGGVPKFYPRKTDASMDLAIEYVKLSEVEMSKLFAKDYPDFPVNYSQASSW